MMTSKAMSIAAVVLFGLPAFATENFNGCELAANGQTEQVEKARGLLEAFVGRKLTDSDLGIVKKNRPDPMAAINGGGAYLVIKGEISPAPPRNDQLAHHWAVFLRDPKEVMIVAEGEAGHLMRASRQLAIGFARRTPETIKQPVFDLLNKEAPAMGLTFNGGLGYNGWVLAFNSAEGYAKAFALAQRALAAGMNYLDLAYLPDYL
jgi:hypothetical protein